MATNAPASRKTHITRIFGVDRQGNIIPDMYADVERMDVVKQAMQIPPDRQWQGTQRTFHWCDDPNSGDYAPDGTPSRIIEIVKVCDPTTTTNFEDPDEYIPIKSVKGIRTRVEGQEINGGTGMDRFLASVTNEELTTARVVQVRKIVHHDTNIDAAAAAAAANGQKEYVVDPSNYEKDLSTRDDTQHIDQEIILYLKHKGNIAALAGLGRQTKLLNQYLIDESDPPAGDVAGPAGYNPPYRFDFLQSIINVKFKSVDQQQWLLCNRTGGNPSSSFLEFPNSSDTDIKGWNDQAADGSSWANAMCAASGLGFTVISRGPVAFGTVKAPDGTTKQSFMRADVAEPGSRATVYLGTVISGSIVWSSIWVAPHGVQAVSYANDKFFVTYFDTSDGIVLTTRLAVSTDGATFTRGIDPFPDVPHSPTNNQDNVGGNVAYNSKSKTYAMIGSRMVTNDTDGSNSVSMIWGWSNDGISWNSAYQSDVYKQPGQNLNVKVATIAAGNGVFVAAASFKNRVFSEFVGFNDAVDNQCGFAVSLDGSSWSTSPLPGSLVRPVTSPDDPPGAAGDSFAVAFIKDKTVKSANPDITGYFVIAGTEVDLGVDVESSRSIGKLWKSSASAGAGWSIVNQTSGALFHGPAYIALSAIDKTIKTVVVL